MATAGQSVDQLVWNGEVLLGTRDYGGTGQPVLLIHGACRNLEDWARIALYLSRGHRLVAMDMRSHGRSGEGPWEWDAVLSDIDAVASAYGLVAPVIVGHSLGGMIAAMYAGARENCPAAVNIDGHAAGPDDRLLGMAPSLVRERWAKVIDLNLRILPGGGMPVEDRELPEIQNAMTTMWKGLGVPPDIELASLDRAMHHIDDGRSYFKPTAASAEPMLSQAFDLDLFGIYRRLTRPVLVFNGVGEEPHDMPGVPWWREFISAYHDAVRVGLDTLASVNPNLEVETVDDTHYLFVKQPERTASRIGAFISAAVRRTAG